MWILRRNHPASPLSYGISSIFGSLLDDTADELHIQTMNKINKPGKIEKICVYCGSGPGTDPAYVKAARAFGEILAKKGIGLIYGGGGDGIMGALARATLDHGGEVTGIIPEFLMSREHALRHPNLIVTHDLHERKRRMFELADAFVALPGGVGTLEELVEQLTWVQLGRHRKPVLIANIKKFWEPLCALFDHMRTLEFIRDDLSFSFLVADQVEEILPKLRRAAEAVPEAAETITAADVERL